MQEGILKEILLEIKSLKGEVSNINGRLDRIEQEFEGMKARQDEMYQILKGQEEEQKTLKEKQETMA
ncbi:hypothetical protein, partial [Calderihabitans maritimus]